MEKLAHVEDGVIGFYEAILQNILIGKDSGLVLASNEKPRGVEILDIRFDEAKFDKSISPFLVGHTSNRAKRRKAERDAKKGKKRF